MTMILSKEIYIDTPNRYQALLPPPFLFSRGKISYFFKSLTEWLIQFYSVGSWFWKKLWLHRWLSLLSKRMQKACCKVCWRYGINQKIYIQWNPAVKLLPVFMWFQYFSISREEQGRIHGYSSCMRVGRGRNWGHQIIWAGAVKPKIPKTQKK